MGFTNIKYENLTIVCVLTVLMALISELWYLFEAKYNKFDLILKYYIVTVISISFTMLIALMGDPFLIGIYVYLFIAAALYFDIKIKIYAGFLNIFFVFILTYFNLINPFLRFNSVIFYADIFTTSILCLVLLSAYSHRSMKIINLIQSQQEQLAELNSSLESKVKNRTMQLETANQELNAKNQEMLALNQLLSDSNKNLQKAYEDLSHTETQLIQNEKMASLGMLVAGVAHEINNPLAALNNNISVFDTMLKKLEGRTYDDETFEKMIADFYGINNINSMACERIIKIVKSLRSFARLDEAEYVETDIHESLDNTLILLNHKIKNNIEIIKEYGEIPKIMCFSNQINQVFMNILCNSIDAINNEGKIRIRTEHKDDKIIVKIKDTGIGIKPENLKKIFDPGFTTKGVGVGTGLGMSIVYNIIETHKGEIHVNSEPGAGTETIIILPINSEPNYS